MNATKIINQVEEKSYIYARSHAVNSWIIVQRHILRDTIEKILKSTQVDTKGWISTKDKLPKNGHEVLVKHKDYRQLFIATYNSKRKQWAFRDEYGWVNSEDISYWMLFPPSP